MNVFKLIIALITIVSCSGSLAYLAYLLEQPNSIYE